MEYKHKDKTQLNVLLSHFLYNGLDVISAQLGMNRSEVMRLALYNLLKENYTKKEMDIFASRDDVVDEWVAFLNAPGLSNFVTGSDFVKEKLKEEKEKDEFDEYQDLFDNELEKSLKEIKKKYSITYAEEFLRNTNMNPKEASEYFNKYLEKNKNEFKQYQKDLDHYFEKKYPKERKEIEKKLERLTGKTSEEMEKKAFLKQLDNMEEYYQGTIDAKDNYMDKSRVKEAKEGLKQIQDIRKRFEEKEILRKYKEKYLKKYADDPGLVELIKNCNDIEKFEAIRGVRNPQAVYQILIPASKV